MGHSPQEALGAVLVAGILFLIISVTPIRAWIINSIPKSLKLGIGAGIGLFLAIIGFEIMGLTVTTFIEGVPWEYQDPTLIKLGSLTKPMVLIGLAALITMFVLDKMKIKGTIVISLIAWSAVAWLAGQANFYGVASWDIPEMTHLFDFSLSAALTASMATVVFTIFFVDFFDTAGTLTSVANVAGKVDSDGKVKDIEKAMLADSVGSVAGAFMGTTTVTSYVESGAGVKEGGRTGLTSLVIAVLFLVCIFLSPLATSIPKEVDGACLLYTSPSPRDRG